MKTLGTQVHWMGGHWGQRAFKYGAKSPGICGGSYGMPDFCSRAIISELSTVYDGVQRKASLSAGAKVLLTSRDERCAEVLFGSNPDAIYQHLLDPAPRWKACWGLAQDWRRMWCSKYARCACDPSSGECESNGKIQCCRDMYQLFLDAHPKESAFYDGKVVTQQTARTYFSLSARLANSKQSWGMLRVGHRASPAKGLPTLFAEYSDHATFLDPLFTIDLCKDHSVVGNNKGALGIGQQDSGYYKLELDFSRPGPGASAKPPPRTAEDVVSRIRRRISKTCGAASGGGPWWLRWWY